MIKISLVLAMLFACTVSAFADPKTDSLSTNNIERLTKAQIEHRTITEAQTKKINELEQKVVGNQQASSPAAPAYGKIDYTRYDRLARDCVGVVTPNPAIKDEEAQKLNAKTELEIAKMGQYCLRKQSELAMQRDEEKRRASQSRQVVPPAPGAMREDERQSSCPAGMRPIKLGCLEG